MSKEIKKKNMKSSYWSERERIVIVCLNGGSRKIINNLFQKGKMPNLRFIIKNGAYGTIKKISIPKDRITEYSEEPPQWATLITGRSPKFHGIKGFSERSDSLRVKAIWHYFNEFGKSVGLLNWLTTWPPPKVKGFVIPGWAPEFITYPEFLQKELEDLKVEESYGKALPNNFLSNVVNGEFKELKKISIFYSFLEEKFRPDLFLIGIFGADHLQHFLWKYTFPGDFNVLKNDIKDYGKIIPDFYERFDELILSPILSTKDIHIVLIFDHDFRSENPPTNLYFLDVNRLLEKLGLLNYKNGEINFSATKAYAQMGLIHIHERHEAQGKRFLDAEKREIYTYKIQKEKILNLLKKIKILNIGRLLNVEKDRRLMVSPNLEVFEKILGKINETKVCIENNTYLLEEFLTIAEHSGEHDEDGTIFFYGPKIKKGYRIKNASFLDVLPTILCLANLPVPNCLEGRILQDILK